MAIFSCGTLTVEIVGAACGVVTLDIVPSLLDDTLADGNQFPPRRYCNTSGKLTQALSSTIVRKPPVSRPFLFGCSQARFGLSCRHESLSFLSWRRAVADRCGHGARSYEGQIFGHPLFARLCRDPRLHARAARQGQADARR